MRIFMWLICVGLVYSAIAHPVHAQATAPIDSIVAVVDDDIILRSELDLAINGIVDRIRQQGGDLPPTHLLEKQVLEQQRGKNKIHSLS